MKSPLHFFLNWLQRLIRDKAPDGQYRQRIILRNVGFDLNAWHPEDHIPICRSGLDYPALDEAIRSMQEVKRNLPEIFVSGIVIDDQGAVLYSLT